MVSALLVDPPPSKSKPRLVKKKSEYHNQEMEGKNEMPEGTAYSAVLKGEFPSLSNNSQLPMSSQSSMWSTTGGSSSRIAGQGQRQQSTPLSAQAQQETMYSPSPSRLQAGQSAFQFGGRGGMSGLGAGQPPQTQPSSVDDFPPLNRAAGGENGQERGASLMSALGFTSQSPSSSSMSNARAENGLLNAISASSRATETRTPSGTSLPGSSRNQETTPGGSDARQKATAFREDSLPGGESSAQGTEARNPLGAIGNAPPASKAKEVKDPGPEVQDPLAGMAPADKWGLAGLRHLMEQYPDYGEMVVGLEPIRTGLDIHANEKLSTQIYSLFDDQPPRPAIPPFRLPECYNVTNVQPIETKIGSFNEDTLFFIFYSNPGDVTQHLAAQELNQRNWRWHKKLQVWLTKDEHMMPQQIGPTIERGYYIIWDPARFQRDRRELTLHYADLDTSLAQQAQ